jgi:hypothetical protein
MMTMFLILAEQLFVEGTHVEQIIPFLLAWIFFPESSKKAGSFLYEWMQWFQIVATKQQCQYCLCSWRKVVEEDCTKKWIITIYSWISSTVECNNLNKQ